ncbi:zinc finger AN1 domain-containing stress-associated protein 12 [Punica granatum]|uniref:AN1-type domain-containing protein n=2 Tax=Punica granatum TaxID=22663 RepID=A0A218WFJ7_PUNGR|nr:zinc finger AN1 domain-containing stress-associated protein 12 [Punica granatum]OWM71585.1 hypothetical protein CDL15_Pgr005772 [Punica granatum]PKI33792.1 hypothetical protein CRG98_045823 [Punica granatum]
MGEGTEAFPDLGRHCQHPECNQLDFLPFNCDRCHKDFCLEHRSYMDHECPKPDRTSRKVIVCETCSASNETTGQDEEDERVMMEKHVKSGSCDPSKKEKLKCPIKRCREVLTYSNTSTCKTCQVKVCLKHRFPADHNCQRRPTAASSSSGSAGQWNEKFLAALGLRNGKDCSKDSRGSAASPRAPSVKAC